MSKPASPTSQPYALGPLRFDIAKNLRLVADLIGDFAEGRNALVKELSEGTELKEGHMNWEKWQEAIRGGKQGARPRQR